jgi:hypothetical protein
MFRRNSALKRAVGGKGRRQKKKSGGGGVRLIAG